MDNLHHLSMHAADTPDRLACIDGSSGESLTYAELEASTNQIAQLFRAIGLEPGDGIVILCENSIRFYELVWGAHRAGLYYTPISWHSTAEEASYIIGDSGAKAFIASSRFTDTAVGAALTCADVMQKLSMFSAIPGFDSFDELLADQPTTRIPDEVSGRELLYTSGTTGNPKGVRFPLSGKPIEYTPIDDLGLLHEGYGDDAVVMAPGPLYHASPLMSSRAAHRFGGATVIVDKFDAEETLDFIQRYGVTHMICVPTHFLRMLGLGKEVRESYDLSSLKCVMHTGAPCPVETKHAIIDWLGPIIVEIYAGTERIGGTMIRSEEWLAHPGSIGRVASGAAHVLDEETWEEQPLGQVGVIYFDSGEQFSYHGDEGKTQSLYSPQGWRTLGDIGRMDEEGYIYLTDRKSNMIISGGVNVYPQESENRLLTHPKVADAAVFGIPNEAFGEEVKAVVQPAEGVSASKDLEEELIAFCKEVLAPLKCPRTIDFDSKLPRQDNGKLYKRKLVERYQSE